MCEGDWMSASVFSVNHMHSNLSPLASAATGSGFSRGRHPNWDFPYLGVTLYSELHKVSGRQT